MSANPANLSHTAPATHGAKAQMTLFLVLGIETMLFGTMIVSYLVERAGHPDWITSPSLLYRLLFPGLNTIMLLASLLVAWQGTSAARAGRRDALLRSLQVPLLMGLLFISVQVFDFRQSNMAIDDPGLGGAFFALIAFHALHVLAGVTLLALNTLRARLGDFLDGNDTAIKIGAWFWAYVTAVWIVLFVILYLV